MWMMAKGAPVVVLHALMIVCAGTCELSVLNDVDIDNVMM